MADNLIKGEPAEVKGEPMDQDAPPAVGQNEKPSEGDSGRDSTPTHDSSDADMTESSDDDEAMDLEKCSHSHRTNEFLHVTFNHEEGLETPEAYIVSKTGLPSCELTLTDLTKHMELFYNFYDPISKSGRKFDVTNLHRRAGLSGLYDTSFSVGLHLTAGLMITFNSEMCAFEIKFKIQCGERMLLIKDYKRFMDMFCRSLDALYAEYDNQIVFEDVIGRVMYDERSEPWLVLYQIQKYFFHKIGVEDEPLRIVFSKREFEALSSFMKHCMYVFDRDVRNLWVLSNSLLRTLFSRAEHTYRMDCTGCNEQTIIKHNCTAQYVNGKNFREVVKKEIEQMETEVLYSDPCRKQVLGELKKITPMISDYLKHTMSHLWSVTARYSGGIPLFIKPFVAPTYTEIYQKYPVEDQFDETD